MGNIVKTKVIDGKTCVPTAFLAEIFGVTTKTLASWAKDGCPKADRGWWPIKEVIAWRCDGASPGKDQDLSHLSLREQKIYWETALKKEQTHAKAFRNGVEQKEYLEVQEVSQLLTAFFAAFKQAALGLPRKIGILAAQYTERDEAKAIEREAMEVIRDALHEWSAGRLAGLAPGSDEDLEAAGSHDGE